MIKGSYDKVASTGAKLEAIRSTLGESAIDLIQQIEQELADEAKSLLVGELLEVVEDYMLSKFKNTPAQELLAQLKRLHKEVDSDAYKEALAFLADEDTVSAFFKRKAFLFVDMDGVLTDFKKQYLAFGGQEGDLSGGGASEDILNEEEFWSTMEWVEGGQELWELIKPYSPVILTAVSPSHESIAVIGKGMWIDNNIPGTPAFFRKDKYSFAAENCILIDDMERNVVPWEFEGGSAVLHRGLESTVITLADRIKGIR